MTEQTREEMEEWLGMTKEEREEKMEKDALRMMGGKRLSFEKPSAVPPAPEPDGDSPSGPGAPAS